MPPDPSQLVLTGLFAFAVFGAAAVAQTLVIRRIARDGGQVPVADFRMPDALVALVLATAFIGLGVAAVVRHAEKAHAVKIEHVIPGSLVFVILAAGVAGFLQYRGLKLVGQLGLGRVPPLRVIGWALGLVLVAFALAGAANLLTLSLLHGHAEQQPLIQLFRDVTQRSDRGAVLKIFLAAAVLAPVCEEFLFRGFFYAVGKRYLGPLASGLASALLFAAIHESATAFAGLFVLALCLTLAYERTGSLLVPIGMHALFNSVSLAVIYLQASDLLPAP